MNTSLFVTQAPRELIAKEVVRLVHVITASQITSLIPEHDALVIEQANRGTQELYFGAYTIVYNMLTAYQGDPLEHIEVAMDVMEHVHALLSVEK